MTARKYLKVAVTPDEYARLSIRADHDGLTLSSFVRAMLAGEQQRVNVEAILARIEAKHSVTEGASTINVVASLEPLIAENLLLVRELIAERNAQIPARIAQRVNAMYPGRRII